VELRELELHRLDARLGSAVMTGYVPALEAAVHHERVALLRLEHAREPRLQRGAARRARRGAEVEVRQAALEQERARAPDRVALPQHHAPVRGAKPRDLLG